MSKSAKVVKKVASETSTIKPPPQKKPDESTMDKLDKASEAFQKRHRKAFERLAQL